MVKKTTKKETTKAEKAVKAESPARVELKALIEAYKEQNPAKYEAKREALEARLEELE